MGYVERMGEERMVKNSPKGSSVAAGAGEDPGFAGRITYKKMQENC